MLKKYFLLLAIMLFTCNSFSPAEASDNNTLTIKQQNLVTVSAFTAKGDLENLRPAINTALDNGITINELKEVMYQIYAYAGFPRSLNGLNTLMSVVEERKANGIHDELGREATPVDPNRNRYAIGEKTQTELVGRPVQGKIYDFAPTIGVFLKEHLFGDIFERDVFDYKTRELITVSTLAGIGNVNAQLASHMRASINVGITPNQLQAIVDTLKQTVDKTTGENAQNILNQIQNKS